MLLKNSPDFVHLSGNQNRSATGTPFVQYSTGYSGQQRETTAVVITGEERQHDIMKVESLSCSLLNVRRG